VRAFTDAAALAEEVGAKTQERLAVQELRRLGVRAWRRGVEAQRTGIAGLSSREVEIAGLVAGGLMNREIAQLLQISPRTVERHISNVLAKLGLRNRTELATSMRSAPSVRGSTDDGGSSRTWRQPHRGFHPGVPTRRNVMESSGGFACMVTGLSLSFRLRRQCVSGTGHDSQWAHGILQHAAGIRSRRARRHRERVVAS
jgi:DNA-binding CsgD family transcriptional regulator